MEWTWTPEDERWHLEWAVKREVVGEVATYLGGASTFPDSPVNHGVVRALGLRIVTWLTLD